MKTRRPRRSADETKTHLIEAGISELRRSGMSIGLDAVNLEQAVRAANVPRSSAYAVWSNEEEHSPQVGFQRAVLYAVIQQRKRTLEKLAQDSHDMLSGLQDTRPSRESMREIIRLTAGANATLAADSIEWRLTIALRSILVSSAEESRDQELVTWLQESALALRELTITTLYRPLAEAFEIVPRPQYGERAYELSEAAIAAFSEGLSTRDFIESPKNLHGLDHPDGASGEWTLYALMCEKVLETFFLPASGSWEDF